MHNVNTIYAAVTVYIIDMIYTVDTIYTMYRNYTIYKTGVGYAPKILATSARKNHVVAALQPAPEKKNVRDPRGYLEGQL